VTRNSWPCSFFAILANYYLARYLSVRATGESVKNWMLFFIFTSWITLVSQHAYSADQPVETKVELTKKASPEDKGYPFSFMGTVIVAVVGLISGAIGSLISPWINWGIEKRRLKHTQKVERIKEWKNAIESFNFKQEKFGYSSAYSSMKPYMDDDIIKKFEAHNTIFVAPNGVGKDQLLKRWATDQVTKIEKEWGLV
jgi:hypothetical protein